MAITSARRALVAEHGLDTPAVVDAVRRAGIGRTPGAAAPGSARLHGFAVVEGAFHVDCNVAADRASEAALTAGAVAAFPSAHGVCPCQVREGGGVATASSCCATHVHHRL